MAGEGADGPEGRDLAAQAEAAADAIRAAALRLLKEGEVHPRLVVLAVARVAGELGAATALAGGQDAEEVLCGGWPRSCARPGGSTTRRCRP